MAEDPPTSGSPGFLPPEPGGREPDLGTKPAPPPPPPQPAAPPAPQSYPTTQQQMGWSPSPPPPPGQAWQPQPQQPWGWQPQPRIPDNGTAVAGFVLSMVSGGLLLFSAGMSSVVSIVCAAFGIYYSRQGKARVDRGETPMHRSLAQAGFITGIVALVLSILATLAWVGFIIWYATDEDFRRDFDDEFDGNGGGGFETSIRAGGIVLRALAALLT